jgi:glycerophosphoryl diester phosphodiesterase
MPGTQAPLFIAHRGESHDAPENTLASINLAWERKVPAVEIDVRISLDQEAMVIHNATTGHMAGTDWRVSRRTCPQLRTLDFGRLRGSNWNGLTLPTLAEVLDTVPPDGRLFIEIKTGVEAVEPIRKCLAAGRVRAEQITLIAFKRNVLARAAEAMPECGAAWITDVKKVSDDGTRLATRLAGLTRRAGFQAINLGVDANTDLEIIGALKPHDLEVFCWTVNDRRLARRLIRAGIDGITSDRAAWLMGG